MDLWETYMTQKGALTNMVKLKIMERLVETNPHGINKAQVKDALVGYLDCQAGYYDKWYRYNHSDEGKAYDLGRLIANETKAKEERRAK